MRAGLKHVEQILTRAFTIIYLPVMFFSGWLRCCYLAVFVLVVSKRVSTLFGRSRTLRPNSKVHKRTLFGNAFRKTPESPPPHPCHGLSFALPMGRPSFFTWTGSYTSFSALA